MHYAATQGERVNDRKPLSLFFPHSLSFFLSLPPSLNLSLSLSLLNVRELCSTKWTYARAFRKSGELENFKSSLFPVHSEPVFCVWKSWTIVGLFFFFLYKQMTKKFRRARSLTPIYEFVNEKWHKTFSTNVSLTRLVISRRTIFRPQVSCSKKVLECRSH